MLKKYEVHKSYNRWQLDWVAAKRDSIEGKFIDRPYTRRYDPRFIAET